MLDVDHFKQVNDRWGHQAGDQALRSVAAICRKSLRDIDVLCRYGGEEFSVLLPGTDANGALDAAERLRHAVSQLSEMSPNGEPIPLTISLGVALRNESDEDYRTVLSRADMALYQAKREGRNRVVSTA